MGLFSWFTELFSKKTKWQNKKNEFIKRVSQNRNVPLNTRIIVNQHQMVLIVAKNRLCEVFSQGDFILSPVTMPTVNKLCKLSKAVKNKKTKALEFPKYFDGEIIYVNCESITLQTKSLRFIIFDKQIGKIKLRLDYSFDFVVSNINDFGKYFVSKRVYTRDKNYKRHICYLVNIQLKKLLHKTCMQIQNFILKNANIEEELTTLLSNSTIKNGITISNIKIQNTIFSRRTKRLINEKIGQGEVALNYAFNDEIIDETEPQVDEQKNTAHSILFGGNKTNEEANLVDELKITEQNEPVNSYSLPNIEDILNYEENTPKKCPLCGVTVLKEATYCHKCGTKLK